MAGASVLRIVRAYVLIRRQGLFDSKWYRASARNLRGVKRAFPLFHFVRSGGRKGFSPHPLFDADWYLRTNPDVAISGVNPLEHYIRIGAAEGRDPHPLFDTDWYLEHYPDVAASGVNPLTHYVFRGGREKRDPNPDFDTAAYLQRNPDAQKTRANPLVHYVLTQHYPWGPPWRRAEWRQQALGRLVARYGDAGEVTAATLTGFARDGLKDFASVFSPFRPMNVVVDPRRTAEPVLNILLPVIGERGLSGGPNTAYLLACLLARAGIAIRFVAHDSPPDGSLGRVKRHIHRISGLDPDELGLAFADGSTPDQPLSVGGRDLFMATAWWTAQSAKAAAHMIGQSRFVYLIQDYEPFFYGASELFAAAEETYSFEHLPVMNSALLRDHFVGNRIGRFADPSFAASALVFDPAVDRTFFRPEAEPTSRQRRLLFYSRPTIAERNLFPMGVAALRAAVERGLFGTDGWEFIGIGEHFEPVPLGRNYTLSASPWLSFDKYAELMRNSDILLSLMLSPHPSYPPLEMAASGGVAVTTSFGSKTPERLAEISPNIIGVPASIDELLIGLTRARDLSADKSERRSAATRVALPSSWSDCLAPVVTGLLRELAKDGLRPTPKEVRLDPPTTFVRADPEFGDTPRFYAERASARKRDFRLGSTRGLISLITAVYDTKASYLTDLAQSVFGQDADVDFEWIILDNGSSDPSTLAALAKITGHPSVVSGRVEQGLGIIGGFRWCLERATGRYILPVDHDDLLFPDCLRVVAAFLEQAGMPALIYTDEDKTDGDGHLEAYYKPDWDPVLFAHSCYTAHLAAIDRRLALALDCYTDKATEGSFDWDTFVRFLVAGYEPVHLPELLYTWRKHPGSTAMNIGSKPYIYASQKAVLERLLAGLGKSAEYEVVLSELFDGAPDYRFRPRDTLASVAIPSIELSARVTRAALLDALAAIPPEHSLVHLHSDDCVIAGTAYADEARTLFDIFPRVVMVGGRIHAGGILMETGYVFGYSGGIGCPDAGKPLRYKGYFAQGWKPHSVAAVSARHAIVQRSFLENCVPQLPTELDLSMVGPWLGALARTGGGRVVYSPLVEAKLEKLAPVRLATEDLRAFNAVFGALSRDAIGYGPTLDRSGAAPHQPSVAPAKLELFPYPAFLEFRQTRRSELPPPTAPAPITILTTVYERTNVDFLKRTAASVRDQTLAPAEWVVLAHGPIPPELKSLLGDLEGERLIRLLTHATSLGIHGSARFCLERAVAEYVLPLDADDLLVPDAIAILSKAAAENPKARLFYSDEDMLVDDVPRSPFYRPDFDPVLLFAHSFIWHAILYHRDTAVSLGAYTAADAEYAQDWDLVARFAFAGHRAEHVRETLYHWRQHPRSLSHSGTAFEGSAHSVRAVLEFIRKRANAVNYEIAPLPIDLGIQDFYLRRLPMDAPATLLVTLGGTGQAARGAFPFAGAAIVAGHRGGDGLQSLLDVLRSFDHPFAMILSSALAHIDENGLWQAIKHFELVADVAAVGGPLIGPGGGIVFGAPVLLDAWTLCDPLAGRQASEPGEYSFAAKPHCVSVLTPDLLFARRDFLVAALEAAPERVSLRSLGAWLGSFALQQRRLLVFEPLLRGYLRGERDVVGDTIEGLQTSWNAMWTRPLPSVPAHGLASFVSHKSQHK